MSLFDELAEAGNLAFTALMHPERLLKDASDDTEVIVSIDHPVGKPAPVACRACGGKGILGAVGFECQCGRCKGGGCEP